MEAQASLFAQGGQPPLASEAGQGPAGMEAGVARAAVPYGWWPAELGEPTTAGSRNAWRYAYFAGVRRLAVDAGGKVEVYDTTGFNIDGLAPKQPKGGRPVFVSNRGPLKLDALPRVYSLEEPDALDGASVAASAPPAPPVPVPNASANDAAVIIATIEQLAGLKDKGILTPQEFAAKKAELLSRI
jgi:hypothetical protein